MQQQLAELKAQNATIMAALAKLAQSESLAMR
jgi:hypothetical protein